jgi:hypothetical protein
MGLFIYLLQQSLNDESLRLQLYRSLGPGHLSNFLSSDVGASQLSSWEEIITELSDESGHARRANAATKKPSVR